MQNDLELPVNLQNVEAEQAVLGAILLGKDAFDTVSVLLVGDEYAVPSHRKIYSAMSELNDEGMPIDMITLSACLQQRGELEAAGGVSYLSELVSSVPTAADVDYYANIVSNRFMQRMAVTESHRITEQAKRSTDPAAIFAAMQEAGAALQERTKKGSDFRQIKDVAIETFEGIEYRSTKKHQGVTGIPSGFRDLDNLTSGFQRSDLIIVGARPSVGKTAFALNIAQNVGMREKETVAIFSLEMGATQLVQRMISAEANIDASKLRTGFLDGDDWEKLTMSIGALSEAPIYIDDTPGIRATEIRAKCRRLKKEKGLGLILIDYLQLMSGHKRGENRQQEVSEISRTLKLIARELDVTVIALSQLSRGVEQRQDKRPMMSDLRESGAIEQDADLVAFLYRDDYYNAESEKKNIIEIIIAKHRNGPVGTVELAFLKNYNKFMSLDRSHQESTPKRSEEDEDKNSNRKWA